MKFILVGSHSLHYTTAFHKSNCKKCPFVLECAKVIIMKKQLRGSIYLLLATIMWGSTFVAQSVGMDYIGPFTFQAVRCGLAVIGLLPLIYIMDKKAGRSFRKEWANKQLWVGGLLCALPLFLAVNLQQKGIETTTSGKAGFITALYIVLVPIAGLFLKKKAPRAIWLSVALAVAGLYFLSINEEFHITQGDFFMLLCALCFTGHIMVIDHFTEKVNGIELSCMQFLVCAILSSAGMLATETPVWADIAACAIPLLYVGVLSSGVAYTLQILAQKGSNPTVVSLLMSLESVFATVFGALILHEVMSGREIFGCGLMLVAVVLAQLPGKK